MTEQTARIEQQQELPVQPERPAPVRAGDIDEPPPFLGTWRNVYVFVAAELLVTVLAFWILTRWAS